MESRVYSWKYVTADELLTPGPCEFLYCRLTPTQEAASAVLYDGENDLGTEILKIATGGLYNSECKPPVPIYCRRGLYVGSLTTADGILVVWRVLSHEKGGG